MLSTVKITFRQMLIITTLFTIGTTILVAPSALVAAAKQDAWICSLIATGFGCCFAWLYMKVGFLYPDLNIMEINERVLGKWLGWFFSLLFVFTMFISSAQVLFYIGNFLVTHVFPDTPIQYLHFLFLLVVVMALRVGLEPFARSVELFSAWFLLLFCSMTVFLLPKMNLTHLQPVMEASNKELANGILTFISITSMTAPSLLVFFPSCVNEPDKAKKAFILGSLFGGLILNVIILLSILVLGAEASTLYVYPSYILAQRIDVGHFLQRLEAIMAILWFLTIFVKLVMYYFATVVGMAQLLRLRSYKPIISPMAIIIASFSLIVYPNSAYLAQWDKEAWIPYSLIFGLFYPVLLLITATIRKKMGRA